MLDVSFSQSPQLGLLPPWSATSPTPRRKVAFLGTDFSSTNQPIQCPHTSHLLCWVLTLLATTPLPSPARASIRQLRTALHHGAHDVPPASQPQVCSPASPAPSSGPNKGSCAQFPLLPLPPDPPGAPWVALRGVVCLLPWGLTHFLLNGSHLLRSALLNLTFSINAFYFKPALQDILQTLRVNK